MADSAHVGSIEAVRRFRGALLQFGGDAEDVVVMFNLEARKAMAWLQQDRSRYWPEQLRRAQERVIQCRNDLDRCQLHYGSEDAPSCYDQKKALEKAKRRLRVCEEKVKAVKKWINTIRQELDDFQGELAKLTNWLETDLPRAAASLERMLQALDKYAGESQGIAPPAVSSSPPPDSAGHTPAS